MEMEKLPANADLRSIRINEFENGYTLCVEYKVPKQPKKSDKKAEEMDDDELEEATGPMMNWINKDYVAKSKEELKKMISDFISEM